MKRSEIVFNLSSVISDFLMVILAFVVSYLLRASFDVLSVNFNEFLRWVFFVAPIWTLIFFFGGLYSPEKKYRTFSKIYDIFIACFFGILITVGIIFLRRQFFFSRLILVYVWLLSFGFVVLGRLILEFFQKFLFKYGIGVYKILLLGYNSKAEMLIKEANAKRNLGFEIIGYLNGNSDGENFLGSIDNLDKVYEETRFDAIVQVEEDISPNLSLKFLNFCREHNLNFMLMPNLLDIRLIRAGQTNLGKIPLIEIKSTPLDGWGGIKKRFLDFVIALIVLLILSPLFLLVIILIKLTSKGPIFYTQERVGYNSKTFNLLKFRSMLAINEDGGAELEGKPQVTVPDDDRRTFIGRIIRKFSIDELPQLINVLKGDMSLVGPRPERPFFVKELLKEIPGYNLRHQVRPGMTGWAQVNGLRGSSASLEERIKFDIYYIENWSISFDFKIIFKTIFVVIKGADAY